MCPAVVATGIGVLTSIGNGVEAFTTGLRSGCSGITSCDGDGLGVAGRLSSFDFANCLEALALPESLRRRANRAGRRAPLSARVGLIAVLEAWQQAFGETEMERPESVSFILAGNNLNQSYAHEVMQKYATDPEYVPASYALHFMDTDQVGLVSEVLGIRGEGFSVGGASASGNVAIIQACRHLKLGLSDICVVLGGMVDLSPVELGAFRHTGALGGKRFAAAPAQASRPFDADREGFIYGQGSACLILESERSARERGASIWGRVTGGGICLDGNRSSDPSAAGEARAMQQAMFQAGVTAEQIDYVNTHGTGSVLGDAVEVEALRSVFGARVSQVAINATKGLIGHCLGAASVIEAAATLIQLRHGFLHPNPNLETPIDDACGFIRLTTETKRCQVALSNAYGFGGVNTSIVMTRDF